jgi:hypothetical protein
MASTFLTRTFGAGNRRTWTFSAWIKRNEISNTQTIMAQNSGWQGSGEGVFVFDGDDNLATYNLLADLNNGTSSRVQTNRVFRDVNAWYHIVLRFDSTQATSSDRVRWYVNGVQETSLKYAFYPAQNYEPSFNRSTRVHGIGGHPTGSTMPNGCQMSHVHFCDGYSYDASAFGSTDSTTGEWKINTSPSVSYGTTGFTILKDGMTITDQSTNSNNWSLGAGTLTKTEDCPSSVFCTNNSLWKQESTRYLTHTLGNTMISGGASATWYQTPGTLAFNSGKFYWECKWNAGTNLTQNHAGVIDYDKTMETGLFRAKVGSVFFTNEDGGEMHIDGPATTADYGTLAQNDILGVAVDMDATTPTVKFYKNGSLHLTANASSLAGKFVTPAQMIYQSGEFQLNFGNGYFGTTAVSSAGTNASGIGIFEYDVPTGYTALSTKGLNL